MHVFNTDASLSHPRVHVYPVEEGEPSNRLFTSRMFSTSRRAALTNRKPKAPSLPLKVPQILHNWQGLHSLSLLKGILSLLGAKKSNKWKKQWILFKVQESKSMPCISPHHDNQAGNAGQKMEPVSACKKVLGKKRPPWYGKETYLAPWE